MHTIYDISKASVNVFWFCFVMLIFESIRLENFYVAWEDSQNWKPWLKVALFKNKLVQL